MSFRIVSTGSYVPEKILTNDELSTMVETSDEWITQRVGIKERHISTSENTSDMACKAANAALESADVPADAVDMIICATITAENKAPNLACSLQKKLGAKCPAMDVNCACSSFIYALDTAAGFFERGRAKYILVVGAERISGIVDWKDRSTCVIFGDGAGAVLLEKGDGYLASRLCASGNDEVICIPNFEGTSPFYSSRNTDPVIHMNGQETFKFATRSMCRDLEAVAGDIGIKLEAVDWIVPHQANSRIIDYAQKKLGLDAKKFGKEIEKLGNTSSASIPIVLDRMNRDGRFKSGDLVALCAFGGGLSSAACILRW